MMAMMLISEDVIFGRGCLVKGGKQQDDGTGMKLQVGDLLPGTEYGLGNEDFAMFNRHRPGQCSLRALEA
jgi:hypothetical protein